MDNYSTVQLVDYDVYTSSLEQLQMDTKTLINTINPYSYVMAEKDPLFKDALLDSDILLPDGVGIVAASKVLGNKKIKKVAGADLHRHLLEKLNATGGSCFYLGSSEKTLQKIKERLAKEYPAIRTGFFSPPYKPQFSEAENAEMIETVNAFKPDVLFIGMTAPKQEKWAYVHKELVDTKIICSIGAVFDFYAGTVKRPSKIWVDMGLEWLGRLIKEPKRMWKRTVVYAPVFVYWMCREKVKQTIHRTRLNNRQAQRDILILGYNKVSKSIESYIESASSGINIVGICEDVKNIKELTHYPVVSEVESAINASRSLNVREIYSTISPESDSRIKKLMQQASNYRIRVKFVPDLPQFIHSLG